MKTYKFYKLSKKAQANAIEQHLNDENYLDYDWWDGIYDGAAEIGIELEGFDVGRGQEIHGKLTEGIEEVCKNIIANHGEGCNTYKTATQYLQQYRILFVTNRLIGTDEAQDDFDYKVDDLTVEFKKDILRNYWQMLYDDYYYLLSDEAAKENIEANDYDFDREGNQIEVKIKTRIAA